MAVVLDTNIVLLLLQPDIPAPLDPRTQRPLEHGTERIDHLTRTLGKQRTEVLIPAPVLTEVLCKAKAATAQYTQKLQTAPFRVAAFDTRAAVECAQLLASHHASKQAKKVPNPPGSRGKINFDRQIVSIALVNRAEAIYSDDEDIWTEASRVGVKVVRSYELPRDPDRLQGQLDLRHIEHPDASQDPD